MYKKRGVFSIKSQCLNKIGLLSKIIQKIELIHEFRHTHFFVKILRFFQKKNIIRSVKTIIKKHAIECFHIFISNHDLSQYGPGNKYTLFVFNSKKCLGPLRS